MTVAELYKSISNGKKEEVRYEFQDKYIKEIIAGTVKQQERKLISI